MEVDTKENWLDLLLPDLKRTSHVLLSHTRIGIKCPWRYKAKEEIHIPVVIPSSNKGNVGHFPIRFSKKVSVRIYWGK